MAKYSTLGSLFTAIANSLRGKTGGTGKIVADDFPTVIDGLSTGGITPTGTKTITTNGSHDVTTFATAQVNVPVPDGYIKPSGTKSITTNGTHDVTSFASASVNVSTGITPSGTKSITENGTYDVTSFASAAVNVPAPAQIAVVRTVTVSADVVGTAQTYQLLSNDDFIKQHYADAGFSAAIFPLAPVNMGTNIVHFNYHANRNIGAANKVLYGVGFRSTSTSAIGTAQFNYKISAKGYSQHMRVDSTGALYQYLHTDYILKAGTYIIVLVCTD